MVLRFSELPAHLCWLVTMTVAVGSVFALDAMQARWLFMIQVITPVLTFGSLCYLHDMSVYQGNPDGETLVVCTGCASVLSVPVLALLYATMIGFGWMVRVFYFTLFAKVGLWVVGHNAIFRAQHSKRRSNQHEFSRGTMMTPC